MTDEPFGSKEVSGSEEMLRRARERPAGGSGGSGAGPGGGGAGGPRFEPCPSCARLIAAWADPCPYCRERTGFQQWSNGPAYPGRAPESPPVVRRCVQCGQRVYSGLETCPHCGAAQEASSPWSGGGERRLPSPGPCRNGGAPLWIGVVVVVAGLVAAGIWGWRSLSDDDYSFEGVDDPHTEAFLSGVREGMEESGIDGDSVDCMFDYLEAGGYFDVVVDMDLTDPAAIAAVNAFNADSAAVADLPEELQTFMEGLSLSMTECLSVEEMQLAASDGPQSYGDDPGGLDLLWSRCQAADMAACDMLFWNSSFGSEYEEYGATCGGLDPTASEYCIYLNGGQPNLSALRSECATGGFAACDLLYSVSAVGSEYEDFALTCGGRNEADYMGCVFRYGLFE